MSDLNDDLHDLKSRVWFLAGEALNEGRDDAYRTLTDFAAKLANLLRGNQPQGDAKLIEIVSRDGKHRALFDPARAGGRGSKCVLHEGEWHAPSGPARRLVGHPVNGWNWWRYRTDHGQISTIGDFFESDKAE